MTRLILTLVLLVSACDSGPAPDANRVTVHRCGKVNYGEIEGTFGRLRDGTNIDPKYRMLFARADGKLRVNWVGGGATAIRLEGDVAGPERTTVKSQPDDKGRVHTLELSLTDRCRVLAKHTINGQPDPMGDVEYAPYDLAHWDFEVCTEPLFYKAAAKSWSKAQSYKQPSKPPALKDDTLPLAAWTPKGELEPGCTGQVDLWINGQADALGLENVEPSGDRLRWYVDYETQYVGLQSFNLHRYANCQGARKLLGVACTQIEIK